MILQITGGHNVPIELHSLLIVNVIFLVLIVIESIVVIIIIVIIVIVSERVEMCMCMAMAMGWCRGAVEVLDEDIVSFTDPLELGGCVCVAGVLVRVRLERQLRRET